MQDQIEHNRRVIVRYFDEAWNRGEVNVLDELLTADYLNHSSSIANPRPGPEDVKAIVRMMREGIPDLHYEILDIVAAPDRAAVYTRVTGTHFGTLFGMGPSGNRIDVRQMQIEWFRDGRICQHWRITDEMALVRQVRGGV